jgi:hypothetical protein
MSAEQGQALADFVLHSGPRVRPKPDCSHLVHLLHARAGLIYPYEDSRVLYRGIADFERVKTPQPGDLAVWLGHVGIVLSPEDKTFLSSVRSGIITETWTAAHWKRRGRPHFFRYRIGPATNVVLLAAIMERDTDSQPESIGYATSTVAERTQFPAAEEDVAQQRHPETELPAQPSGSTIKDEPQDASVDQAGADPKSFVAMIHQRSAPTKRQIAAAITESCNARARRLIGGEMIGGEMMDPGRPLSIFDEIAVTKVQIKHESGTVTVRFNETMSQEAGRIFQARTIERELMIVRHSDGVWTISDSSGRVYVPQSHALEVFERQATLFLARAPNSNGTRAVVKALDHLYDQQPGTPQRAELR